MTSVSLLFSFSFSVSDFKFDFEFYSFDFILSILLSLIDNMITIDKAWHDNHLAVSQTEEKEGVGIKIKIVQAST